MILLNDPQVTELTYGVELRALNREVDLTKFQTWKGCLGDFDVQIDGQGLTARPIRHFPDAQSARTALEPHLRNWESYADIVEDLPIHFVYVSSRWIDRRPEPGKEDHVYGESMHRVKRRNTTHRVPRTRYPVPPLAFEATPLVEDLRLRLRGMRDGREPLLGGANWCLTRLEAEYGCRKALVHALNVSERVIKMLGRLAAVNDPDHRVSRKAKGASRSLAEGEKDWIWRVVPRLAHRTAEVASGVPNLPKLTMADLPPLQGKPGA